MTVSRSDGPLAPDRPDHRRLRAVLGRYPTGVAVLTTHDHDHRPVGLTVNSFTSLSLEPPLVLWCIRREAASRPTFTHATHFAVNILAADQVEHARRFAAPAADRFAGLGWSRGPYDLPLLHGTIGTLVCRRQDSLAGGDHVIIVGRVDDYCAEPGEPLIFIDGGYRQA